MKDATEEKEIFKEAVEDEETTDDESEDVQKKKKPRKLERISCSLPRDITKNPELLAAAEDIKQ